MNGMVRIVRPRGGGSTAFGEIRVLGMSLEKRAHEWAMYNHAEAVRAGILESSLGKLARVPATGERRRYLGMNESDVPLPFVVRQHSDGPAIVDLEAPLLRILRDRRHDGTTY